MVKPNEYCIWFETLGHDGYIKTIKVTIEEDILDAGDTVNVALASDDLYPLLEEYILNNPSGKVKG